MSKKRHGNGKYHEWITEEGLTKIEGWARDGLTNEQIAHNIGITRKTLQEWLNRFSDVSDALKRGKEVVDREVENAMLKTALGYDYIEVKEIEEQSLDGDKTRVERTQKHFAPNTTAQIFWLKNRKPEVWRDRQDIEHGGSVEIDEVSPREKLMDKIKSMKGREDDSQEGD